MASPVASTTRFAAYWGTAIACASIPMLAACKDMGDKVAQAALAQMSQADTSEHAGRTDGLTLPIEGANCRIEAVRYFGASCFAAVNTRLSHGATAVFPNAKPGYRGSTQAQCLGGVVHWTDEPCRQARLLTRNEMPSSKTALASTAAMPAPAEDHQIGVYYFGGWKDKQIGSAYAKPWEPLALYPDREPLLGKYAEDAPGVMAQQLKWMQQYGIDFTVFNWYWARHDVPMLDHALRAYLSLPSREGVKFAVQWSNHTEYNFSRTQFESLFRFWAQRYFKHPDYQRFQGKPVVFIFSAPVLLRNARALGLGTQDLIKMADDAAKREGLPGVSVVGGMWGGDRGFDYEGAGYAAYTSYNYHSPASVALQPARPGNYSRSFAELHQSYADQWRWMLQHTSKPFIVPMSSGWDKRPWGGSKDPLHDDSRSTPAEFLVHLQAARELMDAQPQRTQRMGIVCCWNELGEGSFIEPTKVDGFSYLEQVRKAFDAH